MGDGTQGLAWAALAVAPVALVVSLLPLRSAPPAWRGWLAGAVGVGVALRAFVPARWVMYYTGYDLFDRAVTGELPAKYGPATYLLHRAVQQLLHPTGASLETFELVQRLHGALLPALVAALARATGATWRVATLGAALAATTPLLVRDAASESQLVPVTVWLLAGLALAARGARRDRPQWSLVALALAPLTLSLLGRPELLVLGPLAVAAALATRRVDRRAVAALATAGVALVVLRGLELRSAMAAQAALGNTPKVFEVGVPTLALTLLRDGLVRKSLLVRPSLTPVLIPAAMVAALVWSRGPARRAAGLWTGLALLWQCAATVDLPWLSLPRVQAPAVALGCVVAGYGVDGLWGRWVEAQGRARRLRRARLALGAVAALWLVSCTWTLPALHSATLADVEHGLLRTALAAARPGDTVGLRRWSDPPDERLHLHAPTRAFARGVHVVRLGELAATRGAGRRLAVLGTRCHMRRCDASGEHPACADLRRRYALVPVVERAVQAPEAPLPWPFASQVRPAKGLVGDLDFPWCVRSGELTVGVYELRDRP